MSKWDKLLSRLYSLDKGLRFDELKKILEAFGYSCTQDGTSHCVFRKQGKRIYSYSKTQ